MRVRLLSMLLFGILNALPLTDKHEEESVESPVQALTSLKRSDKKYGLKPRLANRIIRGEFAGEHEFPWAAYIAYIGFGLWCSASLFTPRHVLTAAHCVDEGDVGVRNSSYFWQELAKHYVVLGDHSVNTTDPGEQIFGISDLIALKPDRNRSGVPRDNDLAVVKLNGTVTINSYVFPIRLPNPGITVHPGDTLTIAGWGITKYNSYDPVAGVKRYRESANFLKVAKPKVMRQEDCPNFHYQEGKDKNGLTVPYGMQAGEEVFCTREDNEQGRVYSGDSGSPVMYYDSGTNQYFQVGVLSYINGRVGEEGHANVSYFLSDIKAMIADMDKN